jgi:integrase
MKPEEVKTHISTMQTVENPHRPLNNATKQKLINNYEYFVQTHGLKWERPFYKTPEVIPIIPKTESVTKIISAATERNATIFTILAETGLECAELSSMTRSQIDTEQRIISAKGCKGHASRTFKLEQETAELLRIYMHKHPEEHPFPTPKAISQAWRQHRNRTASKLNEPELKNVLMRNLRNYSGAQLYFKTQDPILIMRHLGHKKLETTMHYLRGIQLDGEEEYTCKSVTTIQEATQLIEAGFQYVTEMDGIKLFKKRK